MRIRAGETKLKVLNHRSTSTHNGTTLGHAQATRTESPKQVSQNFRDRGRKEWRGARKEAVFMSKQAEGGNGTGCVSREVEVM